MYASKALILNFRNYRWLKPTVIEIKLNYSIWSVGATRLCWLYSLLQYHTFSATRLL